MIRKPSVSFTSSQAQASITLKFSFALHCLHLVIGLTLHRTLFYQSIKQTAPYGLFGHVCGTWIPDVSPQFFPWRVESSFWPSLLKVRIPLNGRKVKCHSSRFLFFSGLLHTQTENFLLFHFHYLHKDTLVVSPQTLSLSFGEVEEFYLYIHLS